LNVFSLGTVSSEFFGDLSGAIEHRHGKTLGFHVQDEIFAHDAEANQANITLIRVHFCISFVLLTRISHCNEQFKRMANVVCEISVTEASLAPQGSDIGGAGAVVDFWGIVRPLEDGREIEGIDYEAHREMAEHQLKRIAEQAAERFGLQR